MKANQQKASLATTAKTRLVLAVTFAILLFITSGTVGHSQMLSCANPASHQCLAQNGPNNSWLSWLSGNSRSTQYQLIDLFELVSDPNRNTTTTAVINTSEG